MSFDSNLVHTCTIQRAGVLRDAYNNEKRFYGTLEWGVRCRLVEKAEKVEADEKASGAVVTRYTLLVRAKTDLRELDRITEVLLEDNAFDERVFEVTSVVTRRGRGITRHKRAALEVIGGEGLPA